MRGGRVVKAKVEQVMIWSVKHSLGKETVPRRRNCMHMRYSNEEKAALGKYIDANMERALERLRQGKDGSNFKVKKLEQTSRKAKTLY